MEPGQQAERDFRVARQQIAEAVEHLQAELTAMFRALIPARPSPAEELTGMAAMVARAAARVERHDATYGR